MNEAPLVLTVYEGGKSEPIEPKLNGIGKTGRDWLRELTYGDRFLSCGVTSSRAEFDQWSIGFIIDEAILLACFQPAGVISYHWVDSMRFSNLNKFVALLPTPDKEAGRNNEHHLLGPADSENDDGHEGPA